MSSQRSASLFRFRGTPFLVVMPRPGVHKKHLKAKPPAGQRDPYNKLSDEEVRLARLWLKEDDMEPSEIAALLRRDKSTMTRLLVMEKDAVRGARLALETLCPLIAPPVGLDGGLAAFANIGSRICEAPPRIRYCLLQAAARARRRSPVDSLAQRCSYFTATSQLLHSYFTVTSCGTLAQNANPGIIL